ncbi:hypothetical protein HWN40_03165 [Methanolobus zinderi]|uniref:PHP domain-containing protein n=2 Tax=Methanolobus zinderi TaxID=536044 RepID=A0A7D5E5R3_9EURY|nr:hypothetical protein HWN40_03165 [Methanolobus zinderi]
MQPGELVGYASELGLKALSITDHDTVEGLDIAEKECEGRGIEFIPGIEFTTKLDIPQMELHILGYGFDREDTELLKKTDEARNNAFKYARKVCSMLESYDWTIDYSVLENASGILTKHDICTSVLKGDITNYDFHNEWLGENSRFYVEIEKFKAEEAIRTIHEAGGKAICAHLLRSLDMFGSTQMLSTVAGSLIHGGIDGFEVFYGNSTKKQIETMYNICRKHDLLMTGGSDFHGHARKGRCSLGGYNTYGINYNQQRLIDMLRIKRTGIGSFTESANKERVLQKV